MTGKFSLNNGRLSNKYSHTLRWELKSGFYFCTSNEIALCYLKGNVGNDSNQGIFKTLLGGAFLCPSGSFSFSQQ